ncbi:polysaccharide deacetylase family protein [Intestinibacillus massiliensis]|nr:polysaccharide deacetylase family protein [Intestinibacillus massiliensis]
MKKKMGAALAALMVAVLLGTPLLGRAEGKTADLHAVLQVGNSAALQGGAAIRLSAQDGTACAPYREGGCTMAPLRPLAGLFSLEVSWDAASNTATLRAADGTSAAFAVGKAELHTAGRTVPLDAAPVLRDGTVYAPLRPVAEAFGYGVYSLPQADSYIFLESGGAPDDAAVAAAKQALGPSREELLSGGLLLRAGSDYAVANASRVQLLGADGKPIAAKAADGYYWLPLRACVEALGGGVDSGTDGVYTLHGVNHMEPAALADGTVNGKADGAYRVRQEGQAMYVTPQAFAAAAGYALCFPAQGQIALTRPVLYGYADQTAYISALCGGLPTKKPDAKGYIALTFDDGPTGGKTGLTVRLLDGLKARGAHATFFMCGYRVKDFHTHMERYLAEGHELGNHTMDHSLKFARLGADSIRQQVASNNDLIRSYTGAAPTVMRPVGGAVSDTVRAQMKALGMPVINWSVDTLDWKYRDAARIKKAIVNNARDGDIVLMHDLHQPTLDGVLAAIDELQARGYAFVTVSELAEIKGVTLQPGKVYTKITA